jgi:N utilization substance protein B
VSGLLEKQESIDQKITSASPNWKLARMAPVDLNLIRIAIYETILSDDRVPPRVAINEAVEIAKRYGGSESPNFVNGILSEIFKAEGIHLGN